MLSNYHDELLPEILTIFSNLGNDITELHANISLWLLKLFRSNAEVSDKIKFLLLEQSEENYTAICNLNVPLVTRAKQDGNPLIPTMAKKVTKKAVVTAPIKLTFDPEFERIAIASSFSDKMKILLINSNFETSLRNNFIECVGKLHKIEVDKDELKREFDEFYRNSFLTPYLEKLKSKYNKELLEFEISELPTIS
jgi:hypothetical protein